MEAVPPGEQEVEGGGKLIISIVGEKKNITACREAGEGWDYRQGGHSKVTEMNGITRRRWRNAVRDPMMGVVEVVALLGGMPAESAPPWAENDCRSTLKCHL